MEDQMRNDTNRNSDNDDEAHRLKDQFLLECFLLVGGAVIAIPTLFLERDENFFYFTVS